MNFLQGILCIILNITQQEEINVELSQLLEGESQKVIISLLTILILLLANWLSTKLIDKKVKNLTAQYKWRKLKTYLLFLIGISIISAIWINLQQFATFLGLLSAGIAIALREPLSNLLAWLFILWKHPFTTGDRIEIDGTTGDVIDIRAFQFSLIEVGNWVQADQSTGRIIHIPNHKVLTSPVANYKADFSFIWHEIPVLITLESNWQKAKNILKEIVQDINQAEIKQARREITQASKKHLIYFRNLTPIVYTSVEDSGILLTIRYLCHPQQRRSTETNLWEKILKEFAHNKDIDLAYQTTRFYNKKTTIPYHPEENNESPNQKD